MKKQLIFQLCSILFVALFNSCDKPNSESDVLSYSLKGQSTEVSVNKEDFTIQITFPETVTSAENLVADFELSEGAKAYIDGKLQVSGLSVANYEAPFQLKVLAEDEVNQSTWQVSSFNNNYTSSWGLGGFQNESKSNNRPYDWYLDQANTGTFAGVNCGPTTTTMVAKWADATFTRTPEDARSTYRSEGGWWYTNDIDNYLTKYGIIHFFIQLSTSAESTANVMKEQIDGGNILILCLDMYYISDGTNSNWHVDKFYQTAAPDWGHFIALKGYKVVNGHYYFETYDPYCFDKKYSDGSYKGKDRFYRSADLYEATSVWWNYAIVVPANQLKAIPLNGLNAADVPVQRGR